MVPQTYNFKLRAKERKDDAEFTTVQSTIFREKRCLVASASMRHRKRNGGRGPSAVKRLSTNLSDAKNSINSDAMEC